MDEAELKAHGEKLRADPVYVDLLDFSRDKIGAATADSLKRFKWAEFDYPDAVAALAYILMSVCAVLFRNAEMTPEAFGELARKKLIDVRNMPDDDEDDDED